MSRPTKEEADQVLASVRLGQDYYDPDDAWKFAKILAAEVRALREELAEAQRDLEDVSYRIEGSGGFALVRHKEHGDRAAEALLREFGRRGEVIERIEALLPEWRKRARNSRNSAAKVGYSQHAFELESALKGSG